MDQVLLPVWPTAAHALGVGRTKAFELVSSGELRSVKIGRKRLVPVDAIREFVDRLSAEQGGAAC